jgi:hypothetical protein
MIKSERNMSELRQIARKNITLTLVNLLALLCELYEMYIHTHTHTGYCHRTVL